MHLINVGDLFMLLQYRRSGTNCISLHTHRPIENANCCLEILCVLHLERWHFVRKLHYVVSRLSQYSYATQNDKTLVFSVKGFSIFISILVIKLIIFKNTQFMHSVPYVLFCVFLVSMVTMFCTDNVSWYP